MATLLERNTKRLLAARRNPQLPYENRTPYWPQGGMNALNSIYESYLPQVNGGMLPNANVTAQGYNSKKNPIQLPNVNITGNRSTTNPNMATDPRFGPFTNVQEGTINSKGNPVQLGGASVSGKKPNVQTVPFVGTPDFSTPEQAGFGGETPYVAPAQVKQVNSTGVVNTPGTTTSGNRPFMDPSILASMAPAAIGNYNLDLTNFGANQPTAINPSTLKIPSLGGQTSKLTASGLAGAPAAKAGLGMAAGLMGGPIGIAAQLAPVVFNMIKGLQKPERTRPNYNPYESNARSLMANRRFNVDPMLNANLNAQAVANRNIRNTAGSRGEAMANFGAAQNYRMAGDASAWSEKNNMDNQYMGQQAEMDAQLGAQRAQMDWMTQTANSQNKAAQQQFLGQGFGDVSEFAQVQQQMSNQRKRDKQLLGLYPDMFGVYNFMHGAKDIVDNFPK